MNNYVICDCDQRAACMARVRHLQPTFCEEHKDKKRSTHGHNRADIAISAETDASILALLQERGTLETTQLVTLTGRELSQIYTAIDRLKKRGQIHGTQIGRGQGSSRKAWHIMGAQ